MTLTLISSTFAASARSVILASFNSLALVGLTIPAYLFIFLSYPIELLFLGVSIMLRVWTSKLALTLFLIRVLPLLPPLTQTMLSGLYHQHLLKSLWKSSTVPNLRQIFSKPLVVD